MHFILFSDVFDNVVTFRKADATITLPRFDMAHSGDIYFEFKTTTRDGCLINARGSSDYIKVSIVGKQIVIFYHFYLFYISSRRFIALEKGRSRHHELEYF